MRILHLVDSLEIGGMERMIVTLAGYQKRQGHDVEVATLLRAGSFAKDLQRLSIPVTNFAKPQGFSFSTGQAIRNTLDRLEADVLHTHNPVPLIYGRLGGGLKRKLKFINTRHDMGLHLSSPKAHFLYRIARAGNVATVAVCRPAFDRFIANGEFSKSTSSVIPNGINLDQFKNCSPEQSTALRRSFAANRETFVMGTVGRLNPVKAQERMVELCGDLLSVGVPVKLVLAGDGQCRRDLELKVNQLGIASHVSFIGETQDVPSFLHSLDLFLLTSHTEGYSMALVEASAAGLPILATNVGGNSEIVNDGETGYLVQPEDRKGLLERALLLYNNKSLRVSMGKKALTWAEHSGSTKAMADLYFDLYQAS